MLNFKKQVTAACLALSLTFAGAAFADPTECPGTTDIENQADNAATTCKGDDCTFSLENHRYDTDLMWHFFINIPNSNANDAAKIADNAVKSLRLQSGPTKEKSDLWFCRYSNKEGVEAIAAYSSDNNLLSAIAG